MPPNITWGGFMGGFNLGMTNANGTTGCARSTVSATVNETVADYVPHHNWFQYFASTANPTHARPARSERCRLLLQTNGAVDPANHEYDLNDFPTALRNGGSSRRFPTSSCRPTRTAMPAIPIRWMSRPALSV